MRKELQNGIIRMTAEPGEYTWQSLYEYIESRTAGVLSALQFLREDPRLQDVDELHIASFDRELKMLRSCLALVSEMQHRENLQGISPILSLNMIRLRCRHPHVEQDGYLEFAWISPIAEGRYSLTIIGTNESQEPENSHPASADLIQIVEEVEKLTKEICGDENR